MSKFQVPAKNNQYLILNRLKINKILFVILYTNFKFFDRSLHIYFLTKKSNSHFKF